MEQIKNNPYVSLDTERQDEKLKGIERRVFDDSGDEIVIMYMQITIPSSKVVYLGNSDFHFAGQGFEAKRAKFALKEESKLYNAIMGIGGDFLDNANIEGATNPYGARVSLPSDAIDGAEQFLKPYQKNFAFALAGNHGALWAKRNKKMGIGPEEELAKRMGIPYARYCLVIEVTLLEPDTAKPRKMTICTQHDIKDPKKFIATMMKNGIVPDVIVREHTHNGNDGIYMTQVPVYDKNGLLKGYENHQVYVMTGKSMQNGNTFFGGENMFDLKTNAKGLLLGWKKNPYYTAKDVIQPKYIPSVVPFNVLHKDELRPSAFFEMLLKYYARPNIDRYKENVKDRSLTEVAATLDHIDETTEKKFNRYVDYKKQQKNAKVEDENVK